MQNQNEPRAKTRNLSPIEYLRQLEVEWWICNLRRKIYPEKKLKNYYDRVANNKRDRIKEICVRNSIPSIFDDRNLMQELNHRFTITGGMPRFSGQTETDIINYYYPGVEVRCIVPGLTQNTDIIYARTLEIDLKTSTVKVQKADKTLYQLEFAQVQRIF